MIALNYSCCSSSNIHIRIGPTVVTGFIQLYIAIQLQLQQHLRSQLYGCMHACIIVHACDYITIIEDRVRGDSQLAIYNYVNPLNSKKVLVNINARQLAGQLRIDTQIALNTYQHYSCYVAIAIRTQKANVATGPGHSYSQLKFIYSQL